MNHCCEDLIGIFNRCFQKSHQTILVRGDDEPLYLPMACNDSGYHVIIFAHGYFSSALHECAHWLIAGAQRRLQEDYGYWYIPDGRNATEQALFQKVEIKPQALELVLSEAANFRFQFSLDNLNGSCGDGLEQFKQDVMVQAEKYRMHGLWPRARKFYQALKSFYHPL